MGTSIAPELKDERRGIEWGVGFSLTSQLGTHWLIWKEETRGLFFLSSRKLEKNREGNQSQGKRDNLVYSI